MPNDDQTDIPPQPATLLSYLRLFRLPNVFTALADIGMGFIVSRQSVEPVGALVSLGVASGFLYTAGMVLNDVYDVEIDRQERPFRPLPAGQISLPLATALGYTFLALGVAFGWLAGLLYADVAALPWRSGAVATALAACVVLYNAVLKQTWFGPLGMGLCRFCNVLLGMSAASVVANDALLGYPPGQWMVAAGIGTYIVGVTWLARSEAENSQAAQLLGALVVMLLGIAVLGASANYLETAAKPSLTPLMFGVLLALLAFSIVRRCGTAIANPEPALVQSAVKHAILSLILFDASTCLVVAPAVYGIGVVALLIPTLLLGRWVYST